MILLKNGDALVVSRTISETLVGVVNGHQIFGQVVNLQKPRPKLLLT